MNTLTLPQESSPESPYMGTLSFLCRLGDVTIAWDETNREQILQLVRKKMAEGYTFFTTKKFMFKKLSRKVKITEKNIDVTEEIIITDQQFEKMIKDLDDKDIATLVKDKKVDVVKRTKKENMTALAKVIKAEEVLEKDSVAIRPIVGG